MSQRILLTLVLAALLVCTRGVAFADASNGAANLGDRALVMSAQDCDVELPCSDRTDVGSTPFESVGRSPLPESSGEALDSDTLIEFARRSWIFRAFQLARLAHRSDAQDHLRSNGSADAHGARA